MYLQVPQKALFAVSLFSSYMNQSLREDTPCMVGYTTSAGTSNEDNREGPYQNKLYNPQSLKNTGGMLLFWNSGLQS